MNRRRRSEMKQELVDALLLYGEAQRQKLQHDLN